MAAAVQQLSRLMLARRCLAALLLSATASGALAQSVVLAGRMGERALLVIDGQPVTLAVGQTAAGVRLLGWVGDEATVQRAGATQQLRTGVPVQVGAAAIKPGGREVVMTAGPGGHFTAAGSINGHAVRFMVDTGATLVAIGRDEAQRLGIEPGSGRTAITQTANGPVPVQIVMLGSVRVGDVELTNVGAAIVPQALPLVLLGNSFLARLQMRRDNDVMRLELR